MENERTSGNLKKKYGKKNFWRMKSTIGEEITNGE
jgi:hypothetical protein